MIGYSKRVDLSGGLLHRMRCDCAQAGQLVVSLPMEIVVGTMHLALVWSDDPDSVRREQRNRGQSGKE